VTYHQLYNEDENMLIVLDQTSSAVEDYVNEDALMAGFAAGCAGAGPQLCPLASKDQNSSTTAAAEILATMYRVMDQIKTDPIPTPLGIFDFNVLASIALPSMTGPHTWPGLANCLAGVVQRNTTILAGCVDHLQTALPTLVMPEVQAAIECGEKAPRASSLAEIAPGLAAEGAKGFWGLEGAMHWATCAQWPFRAKEVYESGFGDIKTHKPILFIGNDYDSVTPLYNAVNASASFPGSAVLRYTGYGVSSPIPQYPAHCLRC
jgi:hypothetical protein